MTTPLIVLTIIIIAAIAIFAVKKVSAAKEKEGYNEAMKEGLRNNRDRFIRLKANGGRITAQIIMHQMEWVAVEGSNTYGSVDQLKQAEDLDPDEVEELDMIERYLLGIRHFRDDELPVQAEGCQTHIHPRVTVIHYMAGKTKVGSRNKMRIVVEHEANNQVRIAEVQISVDFTKHGYESFPYKDMIERANGVYSEPGNKNFEKAYRDNKGLFEAYREELMKLAEIEAHIRKFNVNAKYFLVQNGRIVGFRADDAAFDDISTPEQKEKDRLKEDQDRIKENDRLPGV